MPLLLLTLFGCMQDKDSEEESNQFANDASIQIISPTNGDVVETNFMLQYKAGTDVATLELHVDNEYVLDLNLSQNSSSITLDAGNHKLSLVGLDQNDTWLSESSITITVDEGDPWVMITSPTDGSVISNPVNFNLAASSDIDEIEVFAEDWSLGTTAPGEILSYQFTGVGFVRYIKAVGYDDGIEVAEHNITITVDEGSTPLDSAFNQYVMDIIPTYPTDGSHGYYWPSGSSWLGTTENIYYQGQLYAEGDPSSQCYCVGLTFEVFMKAWEQVDEDYNGDGTINGISFAELDDFRIDWYVRDLYGMGPAEAVENYGIGEVVTNWDDVHPGDFIQWWRHSGSGHNAIFIDWELNAQGNRIGFQYWSTQNSTDGINYNEEYFGSAGSSVNAQYFFPARIYTPENWYPW